MGGKTNRTAATAAAAVDGKRTMADLMTPGNRLYLYDLVAKTIGFGAQTNIARVEEALAAENVLAQDVGFETARALFESKPFQGVVKVEVFKKGRVLVTLFHDAEMDAALEAYARGEELGKQLKGKKAWKKAKLKPAKPGEKRRKQEARAAAEAAAAEAAAREAAEAQARAEAEARAAEQAAREAAERVEREAAEAAARAAQERADREMAARAKREAAERRAAGVVGAAALRITYDPYTGEGEAAGVGADEARERAEAVLRQEATLARAREREERARREVEARKNAVPVGGMSDHVAALVGTIDETPERGVVSTAQEVRANARKARARKAAGHVARDERAERPTAGAVSAEAPAGDEPARAAAEPAGIEVPACEPAPAPAEPACAVAPAPAVACVPTCDPASAGAEPAGVTLIAAPAAEPAASADVAPAPAAATPAPASAPVAEPPAPAAGAPACGAAGAASAPAVAPLPASSGASAHAFAPAPAAYAEYPATISRDVYVSGRLLGVLTRILPIQVDLMALLDEDWRVARATGVVSGTRSRATFPLRYLQEDGLHPVEITLRRTARSSTSFRWELALVDGDDGTSPAHEAAGLEGLPLADEGAWDDLSATSAWRAPVTGPARELAQFAVIGTWDALLGELARTAAPERWSYPGASMAPSDADATRYGVLREYFTVAFHRARAQGRLVQAEGGSFAAFNTGLVTAASEDILACFEPAKGDIPWRFAGFAQAGSGELGRRLTSELPAIPQPPTYLESLADVVPTAAAQLVLDYRTLLGDCLGRLPRAFLQEGLAETEGALVQLDRMADSSLAPAERADARTRLARFIADVPAVRRRLARALDDAADQAMRACRRSYRTAVPVFDPAEDRMKLLLPLCLVDDRTADVALVVEPQPSGACQASTLMTLSRAYACARVVSSEQPAWLSAERVL